MLLLGNKFLRSERFALLICEKGNKMFDLNKIYLHHLIIVVCLLLQNKSFLQL